MQERCGGGAWIFPLAPRLCAGDANLRARFSPRPPPLLFSPDELSDVKPSSLEEVHAVAQRALVAGRASGDGLGVLCIHLEGFELGVIELGETAAVAAYVRVLEDLPQGGGQFLCGFREGAKVFFYVQGVDSDAMRGLAEASCKVGLSKICGGKLRHGVSAGAAHSSGLRVGAGTPEDVRIAAERGARLALRTGGGRFAFIERFGPAPSAKVDRSKSGQGVSSASLDGVGSVALPNQREADRAEPQGRPHLQQRSKPPHRLKDEPVQRQPRLHDALPIHGQDGAEDLNELLRANDLQWQARVERLERRLNKMSRLLDAGSESAVNLNPSDSGVSSQFRCVQGLDFRDDQFEAKTGLMSALFEANREIQDRLKERSAG